MPTLVLLRHAKSDYPDDVIDHDRPLAPRGRREAALAGRWIDDHAPPIDEILLSSSLRTRQTAELTRITAPLRESSRIYEASPGQILELVQQTSDAVETLLVVGHAPGIPSLAELLAGPGSDATALQRLSERFPTSAVVVLEFDGSWARCEPGSARLSRFEIPRA